MQWEDLLQHHLTMDSNDFRVKTDIECPKCKKLLWKRLDIVLASNPPQHKYECDCGWVGYH